ncbi:NAD(P)/FAD-dependent oxidoreductase [Paenibacillus sp. GCM10027627]|uniref:NAD(P)/FAD-dependent oxidoreductase n=1 Tax=unclassified Paenibacillus TaxID=185978 RepID=UPI003639F821
MIICDVLIAGGGPAGLSAALVLARSTRSVVVLDEGKPRNGISRSSHGYLTRDGTPPIELRELAQLELLKYEGISFQKGIAAAIKIEHESFIAVDAEGNTYRSRKLILATGVKDSLPPIPGLQEAYGISLFPCPYCDGWEHRHMPLAVIGSARTIFSSIKKMYTWSRDLIAFTNGEASLLSLSERRELQLRAIRVEEDPIERIQCNNGTLEAVILQNGQSFPRSGGFVAFPCEHPASHLLNDVGLRLDDKGLPIVNGHGETAVRGLYVIGDARTGFSGLVGAASDGYEAGVAIDRSLADEDWERCR